MPDTIYPVPAFSDNYIWTLSKTADQSACVVDPGDAGPVIRYLEEHDLTLTDILITHHHPDHTGGLKELIARFDPRVYGPHNDHIHGISHPLSEGDTVAVLGDTYTVIEVPGHTLDHIAFYCAAAKPPILFCGDTLFAVGCGRLFEGTPEIMHRSLNKLRELSEQARVYCTHEYTLANIKFARQADPENSALKTREGEEQRKRQAGEPTLPSTISRELATNPFLRCDDERLRANVAAHHGNKLKNEIAVFSALRQWKDNF